MTNKEIIEALGQAIGPAAIAMLPVAQRWTLAELLAAYELYLRKDRDGVIATLRDKMTDEEAGEATMQMGLIFGQMADDNLARKKAADAIAWAILGVVFKMLLTGGLPF